MKSTEGMHILSVSEVTNHLKNILQQDLTLSNLWLRGEISNFRAPSSGHWYFTIKDQDATMRCVMFRSRATRTGFLPQDGLKVIIQGYVSLYPRDGNLQIYVDALQADGLGALWAAFQRLKEQLAEEGLFAAERKRALPSLPQVVGIVTSPTGAAFQDLRSIIHRRWPGTRIVLAGAAVQGQEAPREIVAALNRLNQRADVEVIILGRGGGSLEELWAFNTESVARAVAASRIPIISAVGHQTDYSIVDWVADLRAATPSAAAELVVPVLMEYAAQLYLLQNRFVRSVENFMEQKKEKLRFLCAQEVLRNPQRFLEPSKRLLVQRQQELNREMQDLLQQKKQALARNAELLTALNPLAVLGRGYAVCRELPGKQVVHSHEQVIPGDLVEITLNQGYLHCRVECSKNTQTNKIADSVQNKVK